MFKSGSSMERNNYRSISILPILSKVLERFVHTSFTVFLEEFKLLTVAQSGFRQLHSTVTALLQVTDHWLEKGLVTEVVFIDLGKAFDTVDLDILLAKLPSFGIEGVEHQWFRSYLTSRIQSVTVDGHLSDPLLMSICFSTGLNFRPIVVFTIFK